jgi:thermitase
MNKRLLLAIALLSLGLQAAPATASNRILVQYENNLSSAARSDVRSDADVQKMRSAPLLKGEIVKPDSGTAAAAIKELHQDPRVKLVVQEQLMKVASEDPLWSDQWAINDSNSAGLGATAAWGINQGSGTTIAVADTGVDLAHEDLQGQFATNPGETGSGKENNGIDDDNNGFIDDWRGWDWVQNDNTPQDMHFHGTHVAGIIAAKRGNGLGITGIAPQAKVLPLRVLDETGFGSNITIAEAFAYAGKLGVKMVNASLGSSGSTALMSDILPRYPNTLFVFAAGNSNKDLDLPENQFSPCEATSSNIICVGASTIYNDRAVFSNYGPKAVDIFAPGVRIMSTWIGGGYELLSGTSMATPYVSGVAALILAQHPGISTSELRQRVLGSSDIAPDLVAYGKMGWRLSAIRALTLPLSTADQDNDGSYDTLDNCPSLSNPDQLDTDQDTEGDVCDSTPLGPDDDKDGVPSTRDNCPNDANPSQLDTDHDGLGDVCDSTPVGPDDDRDGIANTSDNCPNIANSNQTDSDNDGMGNECDPYPHMVGSDTDHDGWEDSKDNCPTVPNSNQLDSNGDGVGDACQNTVIDNDGDGIPYRQDNCPEVSNASQADRNHNSKGDACDVVAVSAKPTVRGHAWKVSVKLSGKASLKVTVYVKRGSRWVKASSFNKSAAGSFKLEGRGGPGRYKATLLLKNKYGTASNSTSWSLK